MLSEITKQTILELQKKYPHRRSALIPALHLAQQEIGYLPKEAQNEIAVLFDIDPNEVNSVVSFYDMFHEKPVGKQVLHICKNLSCMLRGSDELIESICNKLQIKPGETSADGKFTLLPWECLGACDKAPVIMEGEQLIENVKLEDIDTLISEKHHA